MKRLIAILIILLFVVPSAGFAQDVKGYAGIGLGEASADIDLAPAPGNVLFVEDSDTILKVFGGALFNPHFGIEVAYIDFGKIYARETNPIGQFIQVDVEASGFNFAAIGYAPVADILNIYGKAGFLVWDADATTTSNIGIFGTESDDGTDFMFGIGLQVTLDDVLFRIEYERYDIADEDVDAISLAIAYIF